MGSDLMWREWDYREALGKTQDAYERVKDELQVERDKVKMLARALRAAPGCRRMEFMVMTWADSHAYELWFKGEREEALRGLR